MRPRNTEHQAPAVCRSRHQVVLIGGFLEELQGKLILPAVVRDRAVLQRHDRDIFRERVIVRAACIDQDIVALIPDQLRSFNAIPLEAPPETD